MHQRIRPRDCLEIIIDTCSLGTEQLQAIDTLIERIQSAEPRIYQDYRIVTPVQLGTEQRQRIYPEFLRAEMQRPLEDGSESNLRRFWRRHRDHIEIVDTTISQAYRMQYAKTALPWVENHEDLQEKIVTVAKDLAARYGADSAITLHIDMDHFHLFCDELKERVALQTTAAQETREQLKEHYAASDRSENHRENALSKAEIASLARHQRAFERSFPPEAVYFMQALYSEPEIYTQIARTPAFKDFRFNKGERAIEDFIFHERTENNSKLVSLIVSEDAEARSEIKALRDRSRNSVIVVNKSGLLHTVACLTDEKTYEEAFNPKPALVRVDIPTPRKKWEQDPRNARAARLADAQTKASEQPAKLDVATEHEWSLRLTKLMLTGEWKPRTSARAAH